MTSEERRIVEDGYRAGTLLILVATSTVAAGVNLPAKRVILRSLRQVRFNTLSASNANILPKKLC